MEVRRRHAIVPRSSGISRRRTEPTEELRTDAALFGEWPDFLLTKDGGNTWQNFAWGEPKSVSTLAFTPGRSPIWAGLGDGTIVQLQQPQPALHMPP